MKPPKHTRKPASSKAAPRRTRVRRQAQSELPPIRQLRYEAPIPTVEELRRHAELKEERRRFDRDLAIEARMVRPPWLEQAAEPALTIPPNPTIDAAASAASPPRRPGKRPTANWHLVVARELIRIALAGEEIPPAADMCVRCEACHYHPDIRPMQKLLKKLLG